MPVNMNGVAGEEIAQVYSRMANRLQAFATQSEEFFNMLKALKEGGLVNGAPMTLERLQVMENGDISVLPPPPEMTCTEEVTKEFGKNGKKETEAVLASDPA